MSYTPFTVRFFSYVWRYKLTRGGRYVFYGACLSVLGTVTVQIPVYQIFFALSSLLAVAELTGFVFRPKLRLDAHLPLKTTAGQPATGTMTVTNAGLRPAFDIAAGFLKLPRSLSHVDRERTIRSLRRGESATLPVTLLPLKRGLYALPDLRAYSTFPFNLVRSGSARSPSGALLVLPAFQPLAAVDVPVGNRYQPGGIALTSSVGESPEYIGNREYVPGEPARRLDFRSWARLGKPVVREYQEEYYCRIALILDTFVPPRRRETVHGFPDFEAAVSLTASIADALSGGEYIVDLFAAGDELYVFRAGRHTAHFENVLEILACVEACRSDPFDNLLPAVADEMPNVSTVICVFLDWDEHRRDLVRTALESGCSVKVVVVNDGETTEALAGFDNAELTQYRVPEIRDGALDAV